MQPKLTAERLRRRAIVYVRQSTSRQVTQHQESQRRQYALVDRARELGFRDVVVIDEDLGRSGSGLIERPGFQRLVAEVCTGDVGAVSCLEASRLARNGRDWHHLIELCGMVGTVVIDPDGVYDPALLNDRLLLGLKGTMSEFELNLLRQRSFEALQQKARRGELRILLPVGLCWTARGRIELDPDQRIQHAIRLVFAKMTELGSARQVLLWFRGHQVTLPAYPRTPGESTVLWKLPVYHSILAILTNPMYAGAYAFGKTESRTRIVHGRARKTVGHRKPPSAWTVLLRDHHPAYISWAEYERHQELLAANAHMKSRMTRQSGRGGRALLAGLLRCRRCGRMLHVAYSGIGGVVPRYHCRGAHINHGADWCISFGGLRADAAVAQEVLRVMSNHAVEAAFEAADHLQRQHASEREAIALEVAQARYEARLAARRYEAVDPDNRLVARELEARWNEALAHAQRLETHLQSVDQTATIEPLPDRTTFMSLAHDLPAVWEAPTTDMRLKQRILRVVLHEIVADLDDERSDVVLLLHWAGGQHSEIRVRRNPTGKHRHCTSLEAIEIIRRMAGRSPDEQIAATLNRLGLRTGRDNTWTEGHVRSARHTHGITSNDVDNGAPDVMTLDDAARCLGVSATTVRRLIHEQILPAQQVVACAPWEIKRADLDREGVREAIRNVQQRAGAPRTRRNQAQPSMFSGQ
jgi:excisionase family DNA binding protein